MGKVIMMRRPGMLDAASNILTEDQELELFLESTDGLINLVDDVSDRLRISKSVVMESFANSLDEIRSNARRPTKIV